ncbi:Heat shock 70 kDa protein 12A, partial [Cladochytrium tenue]
MRRTVPVAAQLSAVNVAERGSRGSADGAAAVCGAESQSILIDDHADIKPKGEEAKTATAAMGRLTDDTEGASPFAFALAPGKGKKVIIAIDFGTSGTGNLQLGVGDIYLVADCGGGTIDVTVHEVTDDTTVGGNNLLKEEATVESYNDENNDELELDANNLIIPEKTVLSIFSRSVDTTVQHLKQVASKIEKKPKMVVVVGNFSNSIVLQNAIKAAFEPETRVIIPTDPGMCVVKGAVLLAAGGAAEAPVKCSSSGYGIRITRPAENGDPPENLIILNGKVQAQNALDMFVEIGESIEQGHIVTRTLFPLHENQTAIKFE